MPRAEFAGCLAARRKIVENALRDFRLGGAELPADKKARFAAIQEELAALSRASSPRTCSTRPTLFRSTSTKKRTDGHSGGRAAGGARGGAEGRQGRLEVHAARALLLAGDAVRRRPRAARDAVPRERDARLRVRQARMGQHAAHRAASSQLRRERRGCSATRTSPRCRWCRRWPSRRAGARVPRDLARRARPFAEQDVAELRAFAQDELGLDKLRGLGRRLRVGEAAREALLRSPTRK